MQKGGPRGAPIDQKAPVHHHGIMRGIAQDLKRRHHQQHPARTGPRNAGRRQHRAQTEIRRRHHGTDGCQQHDEKDRHLEHIRAQRRAQTAQHGIGQTHQRQCPDGNLVGIGRARKRDAEDQPDHQQVRKHFREQARGHHDVVGGSARTPETRTHKCLE